MSDNRGQKELFVLWREEVPAHRNLVICTALTKIIQVMMSTRMRLTVNVTCILEKINTYMILVAKPEGKNPLRIPKRRWKNNIKNNIKGIEWINVTHNVEKMHGF